MEQLIFSQLDSVLSENFHLACRLQGFLDTSLSVSLHSLSMGERPQMESVCSQQQTKIKSVGARGKLWDWAHLDLAMEQKRKIQWLSTQKASPIKVCKKKFPHYKHPVSLHRKQLSNLCKCSSPSDRNHFSP